MKRLLLVLLPISLFLFSCDDIESGVDGIDGENGQDGNNGYNTLVSTENEPEGDNCLEGGTKVSFGMDEDEDGFLDITEIRNIFYLCNGEDGNNGQDGEDFVINTSSDSIFVNSWVMDTIMVVENGDTSFSSVSTSDEFLLIMLEERRGLIYESYNNRVFEWTYNDDYLIFMNSDTSSYPDYEIYPYSFNSDSTRLYLQNEYFNQYGSSLHTNPEGEYWVFR